MKILRCELEILILGFRLLRWGSPVLALDI
jgi:hypothetical protein